MRGTVVRDVGRFLALQAAIFIIFATAAPLHASCTESRPELRYGNIVAGIDFVDAGIAQALFHQQTLSATDEEAVAISLAPGGSIISPLIAQTSSMTVAAACTGFFNSNYQFYPCTNYGSAPVGCGQFGAPYPVTRARFTGKSLFYPEMAVQGNLLNDTQRKSLNTTRISLPPWQSGGARDRILALSGEELRKDALGFSAREQDMPVILSGMTVDFDASPAEINNTSIVERLWRNSHQANILNYAYEGEAASPSWIAPIKNPLDLIDCGEGPEANKEALILTRPGKYLTRSFWSL